MSGPVWWWYVAYLYGGGQGATNVSSDQRKLSRACLEEYLAGLGKGTCIAVSVIPVDRKNGGVFFGRGGEA